jgi:flagellar basal-body rod protein FlgB
MDFSSLQLFSMAKTKMAYDQQRQDLLSENVANVDTPNYNPRDLKKLDFKRLSQSAAHRLHMQATSPHHIMPKGPSGMFQGVERSPSFETNPNKNGATVEEEMMKIAQNNADYQLVTSLYKKTVDMFKTAIGRTSG